MRFDRVGITRKDIITGEDVITKPKTGKKTHASDPSLKQRKTEKRSYKIGYFGTTSKATKSSRHRRTTEPKLTTKHVNAQLDDVLAQIDGKPGKRVARSITYFKEVLGTFAEWARTCDKGVKVYAMGQLDFADGGQPIPVYAVRCDPDQVECYAEAISGLNGLVIAVQGDAMEVPGLAWCYAHKPARELGRNGMAKYLRKIAGKPFIKSANTTLEKAGTGKLAPSEVVAVKLNDDNRGNLKGDAVLFVNGPRVPKGRETTDEHAAELRTAFDNGVTAANEIGCRKVGFTGISTGIFNFDNPRAGEIAMESMVDALQAGKIDQAVGLFWCKTDGQFEGSTAEGAVATLLAHPHFVQNVRPTYEES